MQPKSILGALSACLTACASPSPPLQVQVPPSLTAPCPPFLPRPLLTNRDLALDYVSALDWGADCAARQKALADAVLGSKP